MPLSQIAEDRSYIGALHHYHLATDSNSEIGNETIARAIRADCPRNPAKYIKAAAQADSAGNLFELFKTIHRCL